MNSAPDSENRMQDLIIQYLTNVISLEDMETLRLWINESIENKEFFNNLRNSWIMANQEHESIHFDSEKSFNTLRLKIYSNSTRGFATTLSLFVRKYAAVGLFFMVIGGIVAWIIKPSQIGYNKLNTVIVAPLGARSTAILPDGTNVWLNAGSYIEYNPDFGKDTRTVKLTGEAFFTIAKDKSRPFLVKTDKVVIKALGTRFNVKAYPEERTITTTLEEGAIEVETPVKGSNSTQKIVLKPKEKIVYYKNTLASDNFSKANQNKANFNKKELKPEKLNPVSGIVHTKNVKTTLYTSWKDKSWILEGEPLGSLGIIMERRFNIVIVFNHEELRNYKFTGTIENETLEQILDAFKLTAPIDYKINHDTVFLTLNRTLNEKYKRITEY
jgi:hypothetical protein